jgi:L-ascorbate metabolism protein UlaG (beta-lactamase superfamily)
MSDKLYYLKPNVKMEPLIWQWYAWPHLIPPATAGCNILNRHLRIMNSYIEAPLVHKKANLNSKLIGGPFANFENEYIDEVNELIKRTERECKELIDFAKSLKEADLMLQKEAQGHTLEQLYQKLPDNLRGLVELVYDLNNQPSIRIIEYLTYEKYYNDKHQEIALSTMVSDRRPFVLSTPRIYSNKEVYLKINFANERLDWLFALQAKPQPYSKIREWFEIDKSQESLFASFFSDKSLRKQTDANYMGDGIRVRYLGHACLLLQSKNTSIIIDPVLSYDINNNHNDRYTLNDLPDKIDYLLITHNHQDHVLIETLLQIRHKVDTVVIPRNNKGNLADPSLRYIFKKLGYQKIIEIDEFDIVEFEDGELLGLPFIGEHSDLNIQSKIAHVVRLKDKRFAFCADSNNLDTKLYENIFTHIGAVDVLFLGMECAGAPLTWLYGPLLSQSIKRSDDISRALNGSNFDRAWPIVELSGCKEAYVYAMGQEPWLGYIMALEYAEDSIQIMESNKFIENCLKKNIHAERLYLKKEWNY